jgi:hypothetical protein
MALEAYWTDGEGVAVTTSYGQGAVWDYCGEVDA